MYKKKTKPLLKPRALKKEEIELFKTHSNEKVY